MIAGTFLSSLGSGTFSEVYRYKDLAVKIPNQESKQRFICGEHSLLREDEILNFLYRDKKTALACHIVDYKEFTGVERCSASLTFGLVFKDEGRPLYDHWGLSLERVKRIFGQLAQALWYLKQHKIIHGDVKSQNILISKIGTSEERVVLIDFGSSLKEEEFAATDYACLQTLNYRSPEEIAGLTRTCAMDMWSLAAVIFEVYTSKLLFGGKDVREIILLHQLRLKRPYPQDFLKEIGWQDYTNLVKHHRVSSYKTEILDQIGEKSDQKQLIDLLGRMLVYSPHGRIGTTQLLEDPFIQRSSGGEVLLPQAIPLSDSMKIYTGTKSFVYRLEDRMIKIPSFNDENLSIAFWQKERVLLRERRILFLLRKRGLSAAHHIIQRYGEESCLVEGKVVCALHLEPFEMNLAEYMDKNPEGLSLLRTCQIAHNLVKALVFLKEKDFIHANVHPTNILLSNAGLETERVVLADFSRSFMEKEPYIVGLGVEKMISYMAPEEALLKAKKSYPIDMWDLALVIIEIFTGKPFFSRSIQENMQLAVAQIVCLGRDYPLGVVESVWRWSMDTKSFARQKMQFSGKTLQQMRIEKGSEASKLFVLLDKMLTYLPEKRLTPEQFLEEILE